MITLRDKNGAVRFADFGDMPFSEDLKAVHYEKIEERKVAERVSRTFPMLERDLFRIHENDFIDWPLDGGYIN